jgi:hypothetical protein
MITRSASVANGVNTHESDHLSCAEEEGEGSKNEEDSVIGKKETRVVFRLRLVVIFILVASAICVALAAFFYTSSSEYSKFEENFQDDAFKVLHTVGSGVENTFSSLDLLATTMVSYARARKYEWPFVTLPDYANRVSKTQTMSVSLALWCVMIVEAKLRTTWEDYAWSNRGMVQETLKVQATDVNYHGPTYEDVPLNHSIHSDYGPLPYNVTYV